MFGVMCALVVGIVNKVFSVIWCALVSGMMGGWRESVWCVG